MNVCVVSEFTCTFDDFQAMVEQAEGKAGSWFRGYELAKVNDHKSVLLLDVTDVGELASFMATPEMKQWDKDNGCVDIVYTMESVS
jgi:hypothetical protein